MLLEIGDIREDAVLGDGGCEIGPPLGEAVAVTEREVAAASRGGGLSLVVAVAGEYGFATNGGRPFGSDHSGVGMQLRVVLLLLVVLVEIMMVQWEETDCRE